MMGESHCSNIAAMQLFHELKQQFPALPDRVVSQCIIQNSYDRETCARSLRAVQESRSPPGAFPPLPPQPDLLPDKPPSVSFAMQSRSEPATPSRSEPPSPRPRRLSRPASLHDEEGRRHSDFQPRQLRFPAEQENCAGGVAEETRRHSDFQPRQLRFSAEQENCAGGGLTVTCAELNPGYNPFGCCAGASPLPGATPMEAGPRSFTSVSLTLRPPSSEPQPPIDISSQGPNLTYSSASIDPRGFQSHVHISIAHGGGVEARVKTPHVAQRPNSLTTVVYNPSPVMSPGSPVSPMPRSTTTTSAPTTPWANRQSVPPPPPPSSLPSSPQAASLGAIPRTPKPKPKPRTKHAVKLEPEPEPESEPEPDEPQFLPGSSDQHQQPHYPEEYNEILNQIPDEYKSIVFEHLYKKDQMAKAVEESEIELESLKKQLEILSDPEANTALTHYERELRSHIYRLQLECERLTNEVDSHSDSQIPLGETDEEFYKSIYTGQRFDVPRIETQVPPPLPREPPALEPVPSAIEDPEDVDGPSWVCPKCTFANHPLLNKCEECDTPRVFERAQGETQDIHIRVTHHHNFSPQRTVHNWVV